MRRTLFVSIALLATSALYAGTTSDVKDIAVMNPTHRHFSRSHATESAETDLSTFNLQEDKSRPKPGIRNQREQAHLRQHQDKIDRQKHIATIRKTKKDIENDLQPKSTARAEIRAVQRPYQWDQPFQANGLFKLTGVKYQYDLNTGTMKDYGVTSYTYDASGKIIRSITTYNNTDNILNKYDFSDVTIPLNAVFYEDHNYTDGIHETYYIDPAGQKYEISYYENTYATIGNNNILVNRIVRHRDKNGNMVETEKIESETDAQGRPTVTIYYNIYKDKNSDYNVKPYRKYEYEYPDNGLISRTVSYWTKPESGEYYWKYSIKTVFGTDAEGYYNYEENSFDPISSTWYGSTKYKYLDNETEFTRIYWEWDYDKKEWVLYKKNSYYYNSEDYPISYEQMDYDATLKSFYLTQKGGYEYLNETIQIADWQIVYIAPQTKEQLANPESLISSGYKREYRNYTAQELNLDPSEYDDDELPLKYEISSYLEKEDNSGSFEWVNSSKAEYQYVLVPYSYRNPRLEFKTTNQKQYYWNSVNNDWKLYSEYRNEYDNYGENTLREEYLDGKITLREKYQYKYFVFKESGEDVLYKYTTFEEGWDLFDDGSFRPIYLTERNYNDQGVLISLTDCSEWDPVLDTWTDGYKYIYEFDVKGNRSGYRVYNWDNTQKTWTAYYYYRVESDVEGLSAKRESFKGNGTDSQGKDIWLPFSFEEYTFNANGNILTSVYYEDWNTQKSNWDTGSKNENTYNSDGFLTLQIKYQFINGQWVYNEKIEQDYNAYGYNTLYLKSTYNVGSGKWVKNFKEVFTFTESNIEENYYYYEYDDNGNEILKEKDIAEVNGNNWTYIYSILNDAGQWEFTEKNEYIRDMTNLIYSHCHSEWNTSTSSWQYHCKEITSYRLFDIGYRTVSEEEYDWDVTTGTWVGSQEGKTEYEYDDKGLLIAEANYEWDYNLNEWYGTDKIEEVYDAYDNLILYAKYSWDDAKKDWYGVDNKEEYAFDENNNQTLYAEYSWDYSNWRWKGVSKTEKEYDDDGNNIKATYYIGTDSQGNWIGDSKYIEYDKDGISHYEYYDWNSQRNDWEGEFMSSYTSTDKGYYREEYEWDYSDWCWVGIVKSYNEYMDGVDIRIEYTWDKTTKTWLEDSKYEVVSSETDNSEKEVCTYYAWKNAQWVLDFRLTREVVFNSDNNYDYILITNELYDATSGSWKKDYTLKWQYNYSQRTGVESILNSASISVFEGVITVNATEGSSITIASAAGGEIASGNGSISTAVAPGIYMITVNGNTTKVSVR